MTSDCSFALRPAGVEWFASILSDSLILQERMYAYYLFFKGYLLKPKMAVTKTVPNCAQDDSNSSNKMDG